MYNRPIGVNYFQISYHTLVALSDYRRILDESKIKKWCLCNLLLLICSSIVVWHLANFPRAFAMENLSALTWSHATNTQALLTSVLLTDVQMIEADIVYGQLENDSSKELQPIMAHPPTLKSDISLKSFLVQIYQFNQKHDNDKAKRKGVKLDFKSTDAFQNSLPILIELWPTMNFPVWINADIFRGPVNNTLTTPVDADIFFNGTKLLQNATLSTGWTTLWGADFTDGNYTDEQIDEMIQGFKKNDIRNPITFPVRAGIAAHSIKQLDHLYKSLNESNSVTFTIWSSEKDNVDIEKLREMVFHFGLDKIYIDVPSTLLEQLRLDAGLV